MKAMREFAMADPNNCHKEWAAYMALVKAKGTAAVSSPTSATSPPCSRARPVATTALASSTDVPATGRAATATATPFQTAPHAESQKDKWAARFEALFDDALAVVRAERKAAENSQGTSSPTTSSHFDPLEAATSRPHAPTAEALGLTPALVRPVFTVAPAASFTADPAATTATGISLPAPGYAASASCDIDIILETPATCSTGCLQGNTSVVSTLGVRCVERAASMVSDAIFNAESLAICSTVCPSHEKDMTQQPDVGLVAFSATEGIELSNTLMVPRPLKFFIVQNVTAVALVFGPLDIGLDIDIAFKRHNSDSASSLLIKTHTWYAQCRCPPISLYGLGLVLSVAQHVFLAMSNMTTVVSEKDWLSFLCANLRQPWPLPFGVHSSAFLFEAHMLDNLQVELVQLQPWPSWQLFLSVLTMMSYFCDILVFTSSEVKWKNRLVLNNYGSWSDTMLLYSPSQISGQSCAIPDNCYKWLILCGGIESKIIKLQFLGGLLERYWSNKFYYKGKQLLHCASVNTIPFQPAVASGHSEIVPSLQSRGTQATVLSDRVASVYLVVSSAHIVLNFSGRQPSQVIVLCLALNQITEFSSKGMSSWYYVVHSVHQNLLQRCMAYIWFSCEFRLVIDSFFQAWAHSCLTGHIIQYGSELFQWKISWLFSLQLVASWFQCYSVVCLALTFLRARSISCYFEYALAWGQQGSTTVKVAKCYPKERSSREFQVPIMEQMMLTRRHVIQCGLEIIQWEIAWSLDMESSGETKYRQTFYAITLIHEAYLEKSSATTFRCFAAIQVPWDPGGSTSCRLEGKPNFKRGGLSATLLLGLYGGLDDGLQALNLGLLIPQEKQLPVQIHGTQLRRGWLGTDGRRLRPRLARRALSSSSSRVIPLLL